jgi:hypothetical protein
MNLIVIFMTCTCIVMHSLFCQLPNCNLFTQHVISLWRDTSSELWTPVHSFTFILPSTANIVYFPQALFYFTTNKYLFPHYTSNHLFSANQWDWQPHCKLGQSSLVVLCAGSTLLLAPRLPCQPRTRLLSGTLPKSASNNLQKWFLSPTDRLNFGFILLCSSYLPLGISQRVLLDITRLFREQPMSEAMRACVGERRVWGPIMYGSSPRQSEAVMNPEENRNLFKKIAKAPKGLKLL